MVQFTVIIPTQNRPDYLRESVRSVLQQAGVVFEVIVVNDGTGEIDSFEDNRVRILNNARRGAVLARNIGVEYARGHGIAFLDDDDVWSRSDHLASAADALTTADFFFADGDVVFPDGTKKPFALEATATTLERDNTILISAVCYKKSLHQTLGSFDAALPYYWDWDWYLRVARSGAAIFHRHESVVDIRVHAQNMSGDKNKSFRRANLDLFTQKHGLDEIPLKSHVDFV
jgi:glycosyltransferase involved in cell wall biosynthesis